MKTFDRELLALQISKMKIGDYRPVNCAEARQYALNVARTLRQTGTVKWSLVSRKTKSKHTWIMTAVPTEL